jgi:hypothetical protein
VRIDLCRKNGDAPPLLSDREFLTRLGRRILFAVLNYSDELEQHVAEVDALYTLSSIRNQTMSTLVACRRWALKFKLKHAEVTVAVEPPKSKVPNFRTKKEMVKHVMDIAKEMAHRNGGRIQLVELDF